MASTKLRIIVTGYAGCVPVGGVAWDYLQYAIGLARLGHEIYYHEDTLKWPYHPLKAERVEQGTYSARFIRNFFARFAPELLDHWHYFHLREKSYGMSRVQFQEIARTADLFLNISGSASIPQELSSHCKKVFIDTDPGYNQIRMFQKKETTGKIPGFLRSHDQYFTYAENIYGDDCELPRLGVNWKTTRMPIVLDLWKVTPATARTSSPWTTVLSWSEFKEELEFKGMHYESKAQEFEKILSLPQKVPLDFQLAIGGNRPPLDRLRQHGWKLISGPRATQTAAKYQEFIAESRGEISIAKHVYSAMRTGWFSCRSACYLAAARPVVVQDTGFTNIIKTQNGIRTFGNLEEAAAGLKEMEADYEAHCEGALRVAHEYFDSSKVLKRFISDCI